MWRLQGEGGPAWWGLGRESAWCEPQPGRSLVWWTPPGCPPVSGSSGGRDSRDDEVVLADAGAGVMNVAVAIAAAAQTPVRIVSMGLPHQNV